MTDKNINNDKNINVNKFVKNENDNWRGIVAGLNEEDGHIGPSLRDQFKTTP